MNALERGAKPLSQSEYAKVRAEIVESKANRLFPKAITMAKYAVGAAIVGAGVYYMSQQMNQQANVASTRVQ
jgi:hypothetical protein